MSFRRFGALSLAILVFVVALPVAGASNDTEANCVSVGLTDMVDKLRIIAYTGREIALGFGTDQPGEGIGFVVYVAPSVCTGLGGLSTQSASSQPPVPREIPSYPALP